MTPRSTSPWNSLASAYWNGELTAREFRNNVVFLLARPESEESDRLALTLAEEILHINPKDQTP